MTEYIMDRQYDIANGTFSTVKREEIVRCRDCKWYRYKDMTCHSWQFHNWDASIEVEPDGFCAWGERREA